MEPPDMIEMDAAAAVVDLPDALIRRPLASPDDPDVIRVYERLVIAREGTRGFLRDSLVSREVVVARELARADHLVDSAQRILERLQVPAGDQVVGVISLDNPERPACG